ncbi:DNA adenine methylase [Corynebacterium sp. H130]|uniref:DNA adenine methylase n=1 Tax=Corynebacterium sp. H130 TaxID=3133444 RepID=UPI0030B3F9D1
MSTIRPAIKWSGSKRSQAHFIAKCAPSFKTYFEPFVGGASVAYAISPEYGVAGDLSKPLIELWNLILSSPEAAADYYEEHWTVLQTNKPDHFYVVRDYFNRTGDPRALLFLSRTCVNGLIRFNSAGEFNNSFHLSRPGINPNTLRHILVDWSLRLAKMSFLHGDYRETTESATTGDFIYLDPPYMNTVGRYFKQPTIDYSEFFSYLDSLNSKGIHWALSFDGSRGEKEYDHSLPSELYKTKLLLKSGHSTFRRVIDKEVEPVYESLFLNYDVDPGIFTETLR